jgi:hypothetical protein
MPRDSLYGEPILWSGRPAAAAAPLFYKLVAAVCLVVAGVTLCFAIVASVSLRAPVGGLVLFSAWCSSIALAAWRLPIWWRAGVDYIVTEKHVIWRRGRLRRSIERHAVSYALIRWNVRTKGERCTGDLVLVRAVPTGALRRTLRLSLADIEAPDRVWAIVRGVGVGAPLGDGEKPLAQRLDEGERVLWTATPLAAPWTARRGLTAALAALVAVASAYVVHRAVPPLRRVLAVHLLSTTSSIFLIAGVALAVVLLVSTALAIAYTAWLRPRSLARSTRYIVTNRRVLIRRGNEELCLERSRIAYVIDAPVVRRFQREKDRDRERQSPGLHDVFLVLDGPAARALAPSGAFGGGDPDVLKPVLSAISDADTVSAILAALPDRPDLRSAA